MAPGLDSLKAALSDRYAIERELGAGGMATVYLAEDLKHERQVAIKVLKPELAAVIGAERFLAEIKTTANLQHPHILPLFDSGQADSFLYFVMPYVEGESLRDRLEREKQLPVDDAVRVATEVAEALEYAHGREVIHRDIKPENILLHEGRALVADFGIALAVSAAGGTRLTETGLSVGTPQYMSPEQATGDRELDGRSDLYSLGCVLYEMLAGEPPHTGPTAQAILSKILAEEPAPVTKARKSVPPNVAAAVANALEKLPADRFGSASELAQALSDREFALPGRITGADARFANSRATTATMAAVGIIAIGLAVWGWLRPGPNNGALTTTRFVLDLGDVSLAPVAGRLFDVARDGSIVIVGTDSSGTRQLYLRRGNAVGLVPLTGTRDAEHPVFSPNGEWVAFAQDDDLMRTKLSGGNPEVIARDADGMQLHWGEGDRIIFIWRTAPNGYVPSTVPATGGRPTPVPAADTLGRRIVWPELLPDGRSALITLFGRPADAQVGVLDLATGEIAVILSAATHAHYVPTGHIIYGHPEGGVLAVPFDLEARRVTGPPVPVLEDVAVSRAASMYGGGATQFAVSPTGFVVTLGTATARAPLLQVARDGSGVPIPPHAESEPGPRFSPDGRFIAFEDGPGGTGRDIFVYDRETGTRTPLTQTGTLNRYATWSPDGEWIYFGSIREGSRYGDVFRRRVDRSGSAERIASFEGGEWPQAVLADGRILVRAHLQTEQRDLFIMTPGDSVLVPFLTNPWDEFAAKLSPDGRWVAYTSNEFGQDEVYVTSFPVASSLVKVSQGGGGEAVWSPDGTKIFYWTDDALMAATVATGSQIRVTGRSEILRGTFARYRLFAQYDVSPTGTHFVMFGTPGLGARPVVAVNWFSELRERMGERP